MEGGTAVTASGNGCARIATRFRRYSVDFVAENRRGTKRGKTCGLTLLPATARKSGLQLGCLAKSCLSPPPRLHFKFTLQRLLENHIVHAHNPMIRTPRSETNPTVAAITYSTTCFPVSAGVNNNVPRTLLNRRSRLGSSTLMAKVNSWCILVTEKSLHDPYVARS